MSVRVYILLYSNLSVPHKQASQWLVAICIQEHSIVAASFSLDAPPRALQHPRSIQFSS